MLYTLSERKREDHTRHKQTPTTRASPFIVHNTSLFTRLSKSVHVVYSNQLIATEALDKVWRKKKNVCRFSNPRLPDPRGVGFEERWVRPLGRKAVCSQPTIWQAIYRLAFPRAGLSDKHRDLNSRPINICFSCLKFVYHGECGRSIIKDLQYKDRIGIFYSSWCCHWKPDLEKGRKGTFCLKKQWFGILLHFFFFKQLFWFVSLAN